MDKQSLIEFVEEQKRLVDEFARHWLENNKIEGEAIYPLDLGKEEWQEYFNIFVESK